MDKAAFINARRVARTFHTFAEIGLDSVNKTNDVDLIMHCGRWFKDEFEPLKDAGVDMASIWVDTCRGPENGAYGPHIPTLRQHPEELRRYLSHFRLLRMGVPHRTARYPLPA